MLSKEEIRRFGVNNQLSLLYKRLDEKFKIIEEKIEKLKKDLEWVMSNLK